MWRKISRELVGWKEKEDRMPLILSGVRQCGKTYILTEFGKENFRNTVYVNFESDREMHRLFARNLDPHRILSDLASVRRERIDSETLVIFDEIQACPDAITSLKYFSEQAPEYSIVAAGSLLGVALAEKPSFPVGKVDFLRMGPMDFEEWLVANGKGALVDRVRETGALDAPEVVLTEMEDAFREFLFVGGMPRVIGRWVETHDEDAVKDEQDRILLSYDSDFLKHVPEGYGLRVSRVWESVPSQLAAENSRFFFSHVKGSKRASELEDAVQWLTDGGLLYRSEHTGSPGAPSDFRPSGGLFKLYVCDVGLMSRMLDVDLAFYVYEDIRSALDPSFRGAVAENYVLTELVSQYGRVPRYWRDGKYEVDFLLESGPEIVPVEVKSGWKNRAASLGEYIDRFGPRRAVLLSMLPPASGRVIGLPLCLSWMIRETLEDR